MDVTRDPWERQYAVRAIAGLPGDIFLPQFAQFAGLEGDLKFMDFIQLADAHPRNCSWIFAIIEQLPPRMYLDYLRQRISFVATRKLFRSIYARHICALLDSNPLLLDLGIARDLHNYDGSKETLHWLQGHWDALIYFCQSGDSKKVYFVLEGWEELRESVFKSCPAIVDEYKTIKSEVEETRKPRKQPIDYRSSPIWQELNQWYLDALGGNNEAYGQLRDVVTTWQKHSFAKRAVAENFLGKLKHLYKVHYWLIPELRNAPSHEGYGLCYEAGEALRDIPTPYVWEALVEASFIRYKMSGDMRFFLCDWVEYVTDRLSGLNIDYRGSGWGDESKRPWFQDLAVEQNENATSPAPNLE